MEIGIRHQSLGYLGTSMDFFLCLGTESNSCGDDKGARLSLAVCAKSGLDWDVAVCFRNAQPHQN